MTLAEAIEASSTASPNAAVYAERLNGKWEPHSRAVLVEIADAELKTPTTELARVKAPGTEYFLEVFIINELLEDLADQPREAQIARIIAYE
jgi:hypothetical protein